MPGALANSSIKAPYKVEPKVLPKVVKTEPKVVKTEPKVVKKPKKIKVEKEA